MGGCFKNVSSFYTVQKWHVMCHLLQTTWRKKPPGSGHVVGVFNTEYCPWLQPTTLARSSRSKTSSISIGRDFLSLLFWKAWLLWKKTTGDSYFISDSHFLGLGMLVEILWSVPLLVLMAEILHQLIGSLSHYLSDFVHPRWCRIFSHQQYYYPWVTHKSLGIPSHPLPK